MSEKVKSLVDDIDKLALENPEEAERIIHDQYRLAFQELKKTPQSL